MGNKYLKKAALVRSRLWKLRIAMPEIKEFFQNKKEDETRATDIYKISEKKKKIIPWKWTALIAMILIFAGSIGSAFYFYNQYKKVTAGSSDEIKAMTERIEKFMDLPDETPTLATVTDKEKLKDQLFFSKAENGDKVLVYLEARKAVLFRPGNNHVIEVTSLTGNADALAAPVQSQEVAAVPAQESQSSAVEEQPKQVENQSAETAPAEKTKVSVYNGTTVKGLAAKIAGQLSGMSSVEVSDTTNAKGTYSKTIVIDVDGKNAELVKSIAQTLGGEVGQLPEGEKKPEVGVLIIGGKE